MAAPCAISTGLHTNVHQLRIWCSVYRGLNNCAKDKSDLLARGATWIQLFGKCTATTMSECLNRSVFVKKGVLEM